MPALDVVEVEEGLFGGLDDPLLLFEQVFGGSTHGLGLVRHLSARPPEFFHLRNGAPTDHEAVVVRIDDILLL